MNKAVFSIKKSGKATPDITAANLYEAAIKIKALQKDAEDYDGRRDLHGTVPKGNRTNCTFN
ncbi:hypothetical protein FACS1894151_03390 [Spirochaetia bacterium]|nr:hypothetical protein FACS1894151_03390 [Spirochaetia bacterium]